jgi:hypothetical protein
MTWSAGAVANPYQTDPYAANLISRWDFDDTSWTNDVTANGFNLLISKTGGACSNVVLATNSQGRVERGVQFFPSGQCLRRIFAANELAAWSNQETVSSVWIMRTNQAAGAYPYGFGGTNAFADIIAPNYESANLAIMSWLVRSNATTLETLYPNPKIELTTNVWWHIVEYRASSTTGNTVWINGVLQTAGNPARPGGKYTYAQTINRIVAAGENTAISFGDRPGSAQRLIGWLDNARFYNSASATNNVAWLYQYTHPTNCLETR